jgi:hypothetical protein
VNQPAAFKATYSDWKLVKTRGVVQVIFEVPLADSDAAYEILGGMPNASNEKWFGIAAINLHKPEEAPESRQDQPQSADNDSDGDRRSWREVQPSAQAAMRCDQAPFWAFLREEHKQRVTNKEDAATAVRKICGVNSRAHFNTNHTARVMWHQLDTQFTAWMALERA